MAEADLYVRLAPYNKRLGQLARRCTLGGRTFVAGEWYTLPADWAKRLNSIRQDSGAPMFEVMDGEEFNATARREMAAAMTAAGLSGLAAQGAAEFPTVTKQKEGPKESAFAGLDKAVGEVNMGGPPAAAVPVDSPAAAPPATSVDVTSADVAPPSQLDDGDDGDGDGDDGEQPY